MTKHERIERDLPRVRESRRLKYLDQICSRTVLILALAFASTSCVLLKTDEESMLWLQLMTLARGRKIMDRDITIGSMPISKRTLDTPRKPSQVVGYTTKVPVSKGEMPFC